MHVAESCKESGEGWRDGELHRQIEYRDMKEQMVTQTVKKEREENEKTYTEI